MGINARPSTAKKNWQTTSKIAPITLNYHLLIVLLRNKYFVFILSWIYMCYLKLKIVSISYSIKRCLSSYQLSKFYQRPTKDSFLSVPFDPLQPHVPWAFPKFNKDEKLSINMNLPFSPLLLKSISLGWLHSPALGWSLSGKT